MVSGGAGAELRTTSGGRTIQRMVSFAEPIPDDALIAEEFLPTADPGAILDACDACGAASCTGCSPACGRWATVDYLLWWRRGSHFPPLVTTSPVGTPQVDAGVLGEPTTVILFGDDDYGGEARPGGRVTLGAWLNACESCAVEGRFWTLGEGRFNFATDSNEFPILARPFTDAATGQPMSTLLAFPGFTGPGNVSVAGESDVLGGDAWYRWLSCRTATSRLDLIAGYQFSRIDENFQISSLATAINVPNIDAGTTFTTAESFSARNEFNAGQVGMVIVYSQGCNWELDLLAKVALGNMRQMVTISGQTTIVTPPPDQTVNVIPGPLAGAANSGTHERDKFAVAPELGVTLRWAMNECLDVSVGYSFILWSDVVQAGNQIDPALNDPPTAFAFQSDSYWVHGLNFGAQLRF